MMRHPWLVVLSLAVLLLALLWRADWREAKATEAGVTLASGSVGGAHRWGAGAVGSTNRGLVDRLEAMLSRGRLAEERELERGPNGERRIAQLVEVPGFKSPRLRIEKWYQGGLSPTNLVRRLVMAADHVMVRPIAAMGVRELGRIADAKGYRVVWLLPASGVAIVRHEGAHVDWVPNVVQELSGCAELVEPDFLVAACSALPNDTSFPLQWGLHNTGQSSGLPDADLDAPEAWEMAEGQTNVVVAVLDSGVDFEHPELAHARWRNSAEVPDNRVDDDGNGYIDDVFGWDFVNDDSQPSDDNDHGTHCAGIIGAAQGNGRGVSGVCPRVTLMALKFLDADGVGLTSDAIAAVQYAVEKRVPVLSNSWGGSGRSHLLEEAFSACTGLAVVAAGNSGADAEIYPSFPAAFALSNIVSVASTDRRDVLSRFSNFGSNSVDLSAPGEEILSTSAGGQYLEASGTSMACPHVSGVAALLISQARGRTWQDLRALLMMGVDPLPSLAGKCVSGGRLNAAKSLQAGRDSYLVMRDLQLVEGEGVGASLDGWFSPGEDVVVRFVVANVGAAAATNVTAHLRVMGETSGLLMISDRASLGVLPAGSVTDPGLLEFRIRIEPGFPVPRTVALQIQLSDMTPRVSTELAEMRVLRPHEISGRVTDQASGQGVAGAHVRVTGPVEVTTYTGADGRYSAWVPDGGYRVQVRAEGFKLPDSLEAQVPPSRRDLDVSLGSAQLRTIPQTVVHTQLQDTVGHIRLMLTNSGTKAVRWVVGMSSNVLAIPNATASALNTYPVDGSGFFDDFEAPDFRPNWRPILAGEPPAAVVSGAAHTGRQSLRLEGGSLLMAGLQRYFPDECRPRHIQFHVLLQDTNHVAGELRFNDFGSASGSIRCVPGSDGRIHINDQESGDSSFVYSTGIWHRVEFRNLDWTARRFDYWVDGRLVRSAMLMGGGSHSSSLSRVQLLSSDHAGLSWWDDMVITSGSLSWLTCAPDAGEVPPGGVFELALRIDTTGLAPGLLLGQVQVLSDASDAAILGVPVSVHVTPQPNVPPTALPLTITLPEDTTVPIELTGSDADGHALVWEITELPSQGTLYQTTDGVNPGVPFSVPGVVTNSGRRVVYRPPPDLNGAPLTKFTFRVRDRYSVSAPVEAVVNVLPVNDRPVAANDFAGASPGGPALDIAVLANDRDQDGDALAIASFSQGARGSVSLISGNKLRYQRGDNFTEGEDSFNYTVTDSHGGMSTARVDVVYGFLAGGDWRTAGANLARSRYYPGRLLGSRFVADWSVGIGTQRSEVLASAGQVVCLPCSVFDAASGALMWSNAVPAGEMTIADGVLYRIGPGADPGGGVEADARELASGRILWRTVPTGIWSPSAAPIATPQHILASGARFDRATGTMLGSLGWYGLDTFESDRVFVVAWSSALQQWDAVNGVFLSQWSATAWGDYLVGDYIPVSGRRAYHAGPLGVRCFDFGASQPTNKWTFRGAHAPRVSVTPDRVYAISNGLTSTISALDAGTGNHKRSYVCPDGGVNRLLVTDDTMIAASASNTFVFLLSSGSPYQIIPQGGEISVYNGRLLVAGPDGVLRTFVVPGTNARPQAPSFVVTTPEDTPVTFVLGGPDPDGDWKGAVLLDLPAHGELYQVSPDGGRGAPIKAVPCRVTDPGRRLLYVPAPDEHGSPLDTIAFRVFDGASSSPEATVTFTVAPVNDAPVATADTFAVESGTPGLMLFPAANDMDVEGSALELVSLGVASVGTAELRHDGAVWFCPPGSGGDWRSQFEYVIRDSAGAMATGRVDVAALRSDDAEWPLLRHDSGHSGHYPGGLGAGALQLVASGAWEGWTPNALTVAGGRAFAVSWRSPDKTRVMGLDARSLAMDWLQDLDTPPSALQLPTPCVRQDAVYLNYAAATGSVLHCMDAESGTNRWMSPCLGGAGSTRGVVFSGSLAWGGAGEPFGLNGWNLDAGGAPLFVPIGRWTGWVPSVAEGRLFSLMGTNVVEHDASTGEGRWVLTFPGLTSWKWVDSLLVASEGRWIGRMETGLGTSDLVSVDPDERVVKWSRRGKFAGRPAAANGVVYCREGTNVSVFHGATGFRMGEFVPGGAVESDPIVTRDHLILAVNGDAVIFHLATRAVAQRLPGVLPLAVAQGSLFGIRGSEWVRYTSVPPSNQAPVAQSTKLTVLEDESAHVRLSGFDPEGRSLQWVVETLPAQGRLYQTHDGITRGDAIDRVPSRVRWGEAGLLFVGQTNAFGAGVGSFVVRAHDGWTTSAPATQQVDIVPMADAPMATPDRLIVAPEEVSGPLPVLANDFDPDGGSIRLVGHSEPTAGEISLLQDGQLAFTPPPEMTEGRVTFRYTVSDESGSTAEAAVVIEVRQRQAGEWTAASSGMARRGYVPSLIGGGSLHPIWSTNVGRFAAEVVGMGGWVYATGRDPSNGVLALSLHLDTGAERWRNTSPPNEVVTPAAIFSNRLYFVEVDAAGQGSLRALDAFSGVDVWRGAVTDHCHDYSSPVVDGTGVYVGGGTDGAIAGFDLATGARRFHYTLDGWVRGALSMEGGGLYSYTMGAFMRHDVTNGMPLWSRKFVHSRYFEVQSRALSVEGQRIFLAGFRSVGGSTFRELLCFDARATNLAWTQAGEYAGIPAVSDGEVFCRTSNLVVVLSATNGAIVGQLLFPSGVELQYGPVVTVDKVFVGSGQETFVYDRCRRVLLQRLPVAGRVSVIDDRVLVAATNGMLHAYAVSPQLRLSPPPGTYSNQVVVTVGGRSESSVVHYTLDGSAPRLDSPRLAPQGAIHVAKSRTVRVLAVSDSGVSRPVSGAYVIADSDRDGLPDEWERRERLDPQDATDVGNPAKGAGGMSNGEIFAAGLSPSERGAGFQVGRVQRSGSTGSWVVELPGKAGRRYRLERSDNLAPGSWRKVAETSILSEDETVRLNDLTDSGSRSFYRVWVELP